MNYKNIMSMVLLVSTLFLSIGKVLLIVLQLKLIKYS